MPGRPNSWNTSLGDLKKIDGVQLTNKGINRSPHQKDEQRCEKIRWCSTLKDVPHFLVECETTFGMALFIEQAFHILLYYFHKGGGKHTSCTLFISIGTDEIIFPGICLRQLLNMFGELYNSLKRIYSLAIFNIKLTKKSGDKIIVGKTFSEIQVSHDKPWQRGQQSRISGGRKEHPCVINTPIHAILTNL